MCVCDGADSLAADSGRSSTESLLSRSSPAGMSPQVQEPAPSLSASLGSAETLCDDDVPPIPLDTYRDGELQMLSHCHFVHKNKSVAKCESLPVSVFLACFEASGPAVSVGIVGPLSLGEGELAHTVGPGGAKNLDVAAPMEIQAPICPPKSIISFKGDQRWVAVHPSGPQAVSIGSYAEGTPEARHLPTTTTGVTEVVAMAEVSGPKMQSAITVILELHQLPSAQVHMVQLTILLAMQEHCLFPFKMPYELNLL